MFTLVVGTSCGSNDGYDNNNDQGAAASHSVDPAADPAVTSDQPSVPDALRFRAPLVGGGEIDVSTLAGKPVVFWFWAPY